jgi:hypothetical protein
MNSHKLISNVQRLKTQLAEENDGNSYLTALLTYRVVKNAKTTFANLVTVFHEIISEDEEAGKKITFNFFVSFVIFYVLFMYQKY